MIKPIFYAFSFLWNIPIKIYPSTEKDFKKAISFFPFVGLVEGLILYSASFFLSSFFSLETICFTLILILFFLRGIFHIDGLSDTFDALLIKSSGNFSKDKEKRLKIMKDSTVGVGGVSILLINILGKFVFLKKILESKIIFIPFILTFLFSRYFIFLVIPFSSSAKKEGLGYLVIKNFDFSTFLLSSFLVLGITSFFLFKDYLSFYSFFIFFSLNLLVIWFFKNLFQRKFGGLTGDNLGALIEISELVSLFFWAEIWRKL